MKRIILLALLIFNLDLTAQPTLGLRTGASTFYYDIGAEDHSPPRFFFSVPVELPVKKWFSVQPELAIGQRSLKAILPPSGNDLMHREALSIDLILSPKLKYTSPRMGLFIEGGLVFSYSIFEHIETGHLEIYGAIDPTYYHVYEERKNRSPGKPAFEIGAIGRAGSEIYLPVAIFQLGFQYYQGFTEITEKYQYGGPVKHSSFGFFVGMLVNIRKGEN